jgi:glutamine cyclotransferase
LPTPTAGLLVSPIASPSPFPPATRSATTPVFTYRVVYTYPHDAEAFTQGLVYHDGFLYEGTGLLGRSSLRRVDLDTGEVLQSQPLGTDLFGEGIAILGDRLYQLTWHAGIGFVYDWQTFEPLGRWTYDTEGWGLTHDGTYLIMSDGTPVLRYLDPQTLAVVRQVEVRDENGPVVWLNELEYVNGQIWANVWQTERIARIDPESGAVVSWIDLGGLLAAADLAQPVDVLNGIAYDVEGDRLFVTGKLWPVLFEIEVVEPSADS